MTGVLKLSKLTIEDVMIPPKKVFMLSSDTVLDERYSTLHFLTSKGDNFVLEK